MAEFQRKEKYLVFKLSDMTEMDVNSLKTWANKFGADPVESVVVESHLSVYEQAWKLIELEVTGKGAGARVVPLTPTEDQWGGLARDMMMWLDLGRPTSGALFTHLKNLGRDIPDWLKAESELNNHPDSVPSKGTRCAIIYRAMIEDFLG